MTEQDPFAPPTGPVEPPVRQPPPPPQWGPPPPGGPPPPAWAHPQLQQPWQQNPWAQPGWGQPSPYGGWRASERTNPLAIAALVAGCIALVPVAVGLGIAALVQIRRKGERGSGLAIGGLVASGAWSLVLLFALVGSSLQYESEEGRLGRLADLPSRTPGTCLTDAPPSVVSCQRTHDSEVYFAPQLRGMHEWPGFGELSTKTDDLCFQSYAAYVGETYDDSPFDYWFYTPDRIEWDRGERQVVCVLKDANDHPLQDSVRNRY